jgi:hypothetical protein
MKISNGATIYTTHWSKLFQPQTHLAKYVATATASKLTSPMLMAATVGATLGHRVDAVVLILETKAAKHSQ